MPKTALQHVLADAVTPVLRHVTDSALGGGGGEPPASPPDAFAIGDWSIAPGSSLASVTISSLPNDNGSAITDVEYAVDGGAWVSSGGTGSFDITGLANGVEVSVQLRAVNAGGAGDASDTKNVTPEYEFVNAEAAAIVAAMTTPPTPEREELIDDTVGSLKSAGVWAKLDTLWVFAAHASQAARLNWKNPSVSVALVNSPAFAADTGFASDGSTSYINSGYVPNTGTQQTLNSVSLFVKVVETFTPAAVFAVGSSDGTNRLTLEPFRSTGSMRAFLNAGASVVTGLLASVANTLLAGNRSGAAACESYVDGTLAQANGSASSARNAVQLSILGTNTSGVTSGFMPAGVHLAVVGVGGSLNATEQAALDSAIDSYMANL